MQVIYKFVSIGPKRSLETNILSQHLPVDKRFLPTFSRIIECNKTQETIYKSPQGVQAVTMEVRRSFFRTLEIAENTDF